MTDFVQQVSNAGVNDIIKYDPAAERRAASLGVSWVDYMNEASQLILEDLENGWFPVFVQRQTKGLDLYKYKNGKMFSNFDPLHLLLNNITLKRLHVFKALELFYSTLVTDVSNINDVDKTNHDYSIARYTDEWLRALQISNFYDIDLDGEIDMAEQNMDSNAAFYNSDRRYY